MTEFVEKRRGEKGKEKTQKRKQNDPERFGLGEGMPKSRVSEHRTVAWVSSRSILR